MTTFEVINNNDSGEGSFRKAILDVNSSPLGNEYTINFTSAFNISINTNYNTITRAVTINGNNSTLTAINGSSFLAFNTTNLNIVVNNLIMINNTSTVNAPLINSNFTNLTLIDCRISSSISITSMATINFGIINLIDGTLNIISTYDGGFSINDFDISFIIAPSTINLNIIRSTNCPITINGEKSYIRNIQIRSISSIQYNGLIIYSNSNVDIGNTTIENINNDGIMSESSLISIINIYGSISRTVSFNTCDISNIGIDGFQNRFIGFITSSYEIIVNLIDCIFEYIYTNYLLVFSTNCTLVMDSINRESVYSNFISTNFFSCAQKSTITIGNSSNYNIIFENFNSTLTSTTSILFKINELESNSLFKNCIFRNIDGSTNNFITIATILGRIEIDNCSFTSIETINDIIFILSSNSPLNQFYFTNNIFENINGNILDIEIPCILLHGNNIINECSGTGTLLSLSDPDVIYIGTLPTVISNTTVIAVGITNSLNTEKHFSHFTFLNVFSTAIYMYNNDKDTTTVMSDLQFNFCNGAIYINCEIDSINYYSVNNSKFVNAGNNYGRFIHLVNTLCRITNCEFESNTVNNRDGLFVYSNRDFEMHNGTIVKINDENSIYSLLETTDGLIISNYDITSLGATVIISKTCTANFCNIKKIGESIKMSIGFIVSQYNLNGVTLSSFSTGIIGGNNIDKSIISNSTLSGNVVGIESNNTDIINCTIMDNDVGIFVIESSTTVVNTLVAGNTTNIDITNPESTITSLGNNATDIDTTSTFTQPTDIISPLVLENIGPLENNGGIPETYALLNNNICLNKGNIDYVVNVYDNRGEGYNRVVDGNVDIGSYENQNPIVCFTSDSEVLVDRDGVVGYECVKNVVAGDKVIVANFINDGITSCKYESSTVVHNVITGKRKWFIRIDKDGIGMDEPFRTTHFTGGHMLVIGGKEIKARDIVGKNDIRCSKVKLEEQDVHSFVLEDRSYVNVNGVLNVAFGREEWYRLVKRMNIVWRDNMI